MSCSVGMSLVFRLGGVGFSLAAEDLLEIREEETLEPFAADAPPATLPFRDGEIPVVDLRRLFRLPGHPRPEASVKYLVLAGERGSWAAPVDLVLGVHPASAFTRCPAPLLSFLPGPRPYGDVELWRDELLVRCDALWLEQCRRGI
ncbi:MAG: chemotaxis protein CheW [Trichloromonas sp.]|nr:chemotaxis protein CheW [Trichloromonas sp.]